MKIDSRIKACKEKLLKNLKNLDILQEQGHNRLAIPTHRKKPHMSFKAYQKLLKEGIYMDYS